MKKTFILSLYLLTSTFVKAQTNSYFNEFFDNANYNSAYSSLNKGLKMSFLGYKNLNTPYTPGYFCINTSYTTTQNLNLGVRLINKSFQFQSFYQADAIIGHRVAFSKHDSVALSLNFGGTLNTFDNNFLNQYTEVDPTIDVITRSYFTTGSSLVYTHRDKLEIGAAAPILANTVDGLKPVLYFNTAYNFRDNNFTIRPQVIYQLNNYANFFDFSMQLKYVSKYWAKFSYNTLESSMFGIGVNLKLIDISYAYKLNSGFFGKNQPGLHMVSVAIRH
jgi:hypothetical protein